MAEYESEQRNQPNRVIANNNKVNSRQLKMIVDNRYVPSFQLSVPLVQRKKMRNGIGCGDKSYRVVADLYKKLRPMAIASSDAKTHKIHGAGIEKFHSVSESHSAALREMYQQAKGIEIEKVDAELSKLDIHKPEDQARIAQL